MQQQLFPVENSAETMPSVKVSAVTSTAETTEITTSIQMMEWMTHIQCEINRRTKRYKQAKAAFIATAASSIILSFFIDKYALGSYANMFLAPLDVTVFLSWMVGLWESIQPSGINLEDLARQGGKQAIPVLLALCRSENRRQEYGACRSALAICLPQLRATDTALLTASNRRYLNRVLNSQLLPLDYTKPNRTFALAILKAYEQVGDARAIPVVERLANKKPHNEHTRQIQQAAQECLPLLQTRLGDLEPEQTLLRASTPATPPDILLRPASANASVSENELLRTAIQEEPSPPA